MVTTSISYVLNKRKYTRLDGKKWCLHSQWIWFIFLSFINFFACRKVSKLCFKKCLVLFVLLNCLFSRKFISSKVKSVCTHIGIEFIISAVVLKIHARFTRAQTYIIAPVKLIEMFASHSDTFIKLHRLFIASKTILSMQIKLQIS